MNKKLLTLLFTSLAIAPIYSSNQNSLQFGLSTQLTSLSRDTTLAGGVEAHYNLWSAAVLTRVGSVASDEHDSIFYTVSLGREFTLSQHTGLLTGIQWGHANWYEKESGGQKSDYSYDSIGAYVGAGFHASKNLLLYIKAQPVTYNMTHTNESGTASDTNRFTYFTNGSVGMTYLF